MTTRPGLRLGLHRGRLAVLVLVLVTSACAPHRTRPRPDVPALAAALTTVGTTIGDADRSIDFYSRLLGFKLVSDVEVVGEDVERLEGVFGVRMRVARMQLGEQIDLLEYLAPRDGRPAPADLAANDVAHWETSVATTTSRLRPGVWRPARTPFLSAGAIDLASAALGFRPVAMVRDPDGHTIRLIAH